MGLILGILIILFGTIAGLILADGDDVNQFNLSKGIPLMLVAIIIGLLFIVTHYYHISW